MPIENFFPTLFQHLATGTARNLVVSAVLTLRMIEILHVCTIQVRLVKAESGGRDI